MSRGHRLIIEILLHMCDLHKPYSITTVAVDIDNYNDDHVISMLE